MEEVDDVPFQVVTKVREINFSAQLMGVENVANLKGVKNLPLAVQTCVQVTGEGVGVPWKAVKNLLNLQQSFVLGMGVVKSVLMRTAKRLLAGKHYIVHLMAVGFVVS